jgi:DNA invertase Pin-like site-specific DNA recombinase
MRTDAHQKVNAGHLKRNAYLYVRQSTIRQVLQNTESTKRQYALQQRAIALGWTIEQIVVIANDLGQPGASAADREGFQKRVADVGMGKAGIVLGLEVSRLARNSTDWHRLLEKARRMISRYSAFAAKDRLGTFHKAKFSRSSPMRGSIAARPS